MDNMIKYLTARVVSSPASQIDKNESSCTTESSNKKEELKKEIESEEEREKGWSDMTETEGSESDDDESKLVIDVSNRVTPNRITPTDLDSTRVRSLEETMKFLEGNRNLVQEMNVEGDSGDDDSDEEIVISSSGAPDKYGFLTEIYVPKMRGFEDLSDRCILDSVSVNLTLDQVVRSSMDQFNYFMRNTELTDTQREITKYVRRRARNRVSARKSRMKKISDIIRLSSEIKVIRQKKDSLRQERLIMEKLMVSWNNRVSVLQDFILQYLKDHGEGDDISLEFKDGAVSIVGQDIKPEINEDLKDT